MKEILMELVIESGSLFSAGLVPKKMFDTHERAAGKEKSLLLFLLIFSPREMNIFSKRICSPWSNGT
jgi:hypothetical protein